MIRRTALSIGLVLGSSAIPAIAMAQGSGADDSSNEVVGSIDGTLDGAQSAWVIRDGGDLQTGWEEVEDGLRITLDAFPADTPRDDSNRLTITFTADAAARYPTYGSGEVVYVNDGTRMTGTDDVVDIELDSVEVSGESLLLVGNIRSTLSEGEENVTVVAEEGVTISADMQATIIRAQSQSETATGDDSGASGQSTSSDTESESPSTGENG